MVFVAADLGYVMGTATALTILFGLQLHWGVLLTGLDTFIALGLQSFGIRKVSCVLQPPISSQEHAAWLQLRAIKQAHCKA